MLKKGLVIGGLAIAAVVVIGASSAFAHSPFGGGKGRAAVVETAGEELGLSRADLVEELRAGNSIAQVAENQGVDVNDIVSAVLGKVSDGFDRAVEKGRMTREQADSRLGNIGERVATAMERVPDFDGQRAQGKGRGNMGNHGLLVVAAGELGMTPGELLAELREGKSIADVAEAHDVDVDVIIGAMVEKAEERMAKFEEKVTERINEPWPVKPAHARDGERRGRQFGPGHGRGAGMERHFGGENEDATILTDQIDETVL
ncbi:MAG: hypothetical protein IIB14_07690 [Chloroflexi bacterium]|nr:hypothetical protein [Chloroflexota bacterium]